MLGAITGDIVGSIYENIRTKNKQFRLLTPFSFYTDDTVLTVAVADAILSGREYGPVIKSYARSHPLRGYGPKFLVWMWSPKKTGYNSLGNGSAMRVSPVGHAFPDEDQMLEQAKRSAECTHNHPEGIKGAQAVAHAIYLARNDASKAEIRQIITERYSYDLTRNVDEIRPGYRLNLTCPGSVPEAIIAFLDSNDFEDCIRNAVSLGGDADTQAAIAGAIAEPFYKGVPPEMLARIVRRLPRSFLKIILRFYEQYGDATLSHQLPYLVKK